MFYEAHKVFGQLHLSRSRSPASLASETATWSHVYRQRFLPSGGLIDLAQDESASLSLWGLLEALAWFKPTSTLGFVKWHRVMNIADPDLPESLHEVNWEVLVAQVVWLAFHGLWSEAQPYLNELLQRTQSLEIFEDAVALLSSCPEDDHAELLEWQASCTELSNRMRTMECPESNTRDILIVTTQLLAAVGGDERALQTLVQEAKLDHLDYLCGFLLYLDPRGPQVGIHNLYKVARDARRELMVDANSNMEDKRIYDNIDKILEICSTGASYNVVDVLHALGNGESTYWLSMRCHVADLLCNPLHPKSLEESLARDRAVTEYVLRILPPDMSAVRLDYLSTCPTLDRAKVVTQVLAESPRGFLEQTMIALSVTFHPDSERQRYMRNGYRSHFLGQKRHEGWERAVSYGDEAILSATTSLYERAASGPHVPFPERIALLCQGINAGSLDRIQVALLQAFSKCATACDLADLGGAVNAGVVDLSKMISERLQLWKALCCDMNLLSQKSAPADYEVVLEKVLSNPVLTNNIAMEIIEKEGPRVASSHQAITVCRRKIFELSCDVVFMSQVCRGDQVRKKVSELRSLLAVH